MIELQELRKICKKYAGQQGYYCGGDIPLSKLQNARQSLKISGREDIFGLVDCTVFGSAKDAIAIAASGIYAKNIGQQTVTHIPWEELRDLNILSSKRKALAVDITFSNGKVISSVGSSMGHELGVLQLVNDLIEAASRPEEAIEWHAVIDGRQQGPFTKTALVRMAADKAITPANTHVWRAGMPGWKSMEEVPEFIPETPLAPPPFVAPPTPPPFPGSVGQTASTQPQGVTMGAPMGQQPGLQQNGWPQAGWQQTAPPRVGDPAGAQVDVNSAEVNALLMLPGMTLYYAQAIERERRTRLGFTRVEEVGDFLGLQPHHVERLRPLVSFAAYSVRGGASPTNKRLVDF